MPSLAKLGGRTICDLSASTRELLEMEVRPGNWRLEFYASWLNETESGTMSRDAAYFWSDWGHMLRPGCDMEEVREELLSEWEEDQGPLPGMDSPEMEICLEGDSFAAVRQNVDITLPRAMFATTGTAGVTPCSGNAGSGETVLAHESAGGSDEQPEGANEGKGANEGEGEGEGGGSGSRTVTIKLEEVASWMVELAAVAEISAARQRLAWAAAAAVEVPVASAVGLLSLDLIERVGLAHTLQCAAAAAAESEQRLCVISDCDASDHFFPPQPPCTWEHCTGWKGSSGTAELNVAATSSHSHSQQTTIAGTTRTLTLGEVLVRQLSGSIGFIGGEWFCTDLELDGDWIEWEEWNSKTADMEVTPPEDSDDGGEGTGGGARPAAARGPES
jgi:hypothetical protein